MNKIFQLRNYVSTRYLFNLVGIYHGRIILPPEYPMKPPNVIFMTPNGRFELHKKICLSISGYHPETWRPSWSIRTALLAMIGFMPTHGNGAIGSLGEIKNTWQSRFHLPFLDYTDEERRILTKRSVDFACKTCGQIKDLLVDKAQDQAEEQEEIKKYSSQLTTSKPSNDSSESTTGKFTPKNILLIQGGSIGQKRVLYGIYVSYIK